MGGRSKRRAASRQPPPRTPGREAPPLEVPNKEVVARAQGLPASWTRRRAEVWTELEALRQDARSRWGDWPAWCWLPSDVAGEWAYLRLTLGSQGAMRRGGLADVLPEVEWGADGWLLHANGQDRLYHTIATTQVTAAASWRLTRGIYRYDPLLLSTLLETAVDRIPPEVFLQLPEWCPYVDLDSGLADPALPRERILGFYAHLDWTHHFPEKAMLRLMVTVQREQPTRLLWVPECLPLEYPSLGDAWADLARLSTAEKRERAEGEWASMMRVCLPPLLYLCSQRADVRHRSDPDRRPERRPPSARDDGGPDWWEVGYRIGAALRRPAPPPADLDAIGEESPNERGTHRSPRPHLRRSHWQRYRVGPGREDVRVNLKLPFLVGDLEGRELVPTIRRVRTDT